MGRGGERRGVEKSEEEMSGGEERKLEEVRRKEERRGAKMSVEERKGGENRAH